MARAVRDRGLEVRAEIVRELIAAKELDPFLGLSMVAWPSQKFEQASQERARDKAPLCFHSEQTIRRGLELLAAGWTQRDLAEEFGVPRSTVGTWAKADRKRRGVEDPGLAGMPGGFRSYWTARAEQVGAEA